jgi:hypothetical protein
MLAVALPPFTRPIPVTGFVRRFICNVVTIALTSGGVYVLTIGDRVDHSMITLPAFTDTFRLDAGIPSFAERRARSAW